MKLVSIAGARPQFVKAAVMSRALAQIPLLQEVLVHTNQHYDAQMSAVFFKELGMAEPAYQLAGYAGQGAAGRLGYMVQQLETVLQKEKPRAVMVYGDTDSTLAGALASNKMQIPLIHIEAGLRSFNNAMPEETNRIITDRLSTLLFCPSDQAVENLKKEGISAAERGVFRSGDIMLDAALYYAKNSKAPLEVERINKFILCTLHRQENITNPTILNTCLTGLERISRIVPVIIPLHPHTRRCMEEQGYKTKADGAFSYGSLHFIPPVGYLSMSYLLSHCQLVITDSGGIQKEACFHGKPCLTLREETEWVELVQSGCNFLTGSNMDKAEDLVNKILNGSITVTCPEGLYGNGHAAEEIAQTIVKQMQTWN